MVPARTGSRHPRPCGASARDSQQPRTFTPRHRELHRLAFERARGWVDTTPYFELRDVLAPNTGGGYWNRPRRTATPGIAARWHVDVWGDHNRQESLVSLSRRSSPTTGTLCGSSRAPESAARVWRQPRAQPFPQEGTGARVDEP